MNFDDFLESTDADISPDDLSPALLALWWDKKGEWDIAHNTAQKTENKNGAWVHAYLHRKEGDKFNAGYWYTKAQKAECTTSLEEEWESIVRDLLER